MVIKFCFIDSCVGNNSTLGLCFIYKTKLVPYYVLVFFHVLKSRGTIINKKEISIQGDSGGPLYKFETSKKKAVLGNLAIPRDI